MTRIGKVFLKGSEYPYPGARVIIRAVRENGELRMAAFAPVRILQKWTAYGLERVGMEFTRVSDDLIYPIHPNG